MVGLEVGSIIHPIMPPKKQKISIVKSCRFNSIVDAFAEYTKMSPTRRFKKLHDEVGFWSHLPQVILVEVVTFLGIVMTRHQAQWQHLLCAFVHHIVMPFDTQYSFVVEEQVMAKLEVRTKIFRVVDGRSSMKSFSVDFTRTSQQFQILYHKKDGTYDDYGWIELTSDFHDYFREAPTCLTSWQLYAFTFGYNANHFGGIIQDGFYTGGFYAFFDEFRDFALRNDPAELDRNYFREAPLVWRRFRSEMNHRRWSEILHRECSKRTCLSLSGDSTSHGRVRHNEDHVVQKEYWNYLFQVRTVEYILAVNGHTILCRKFDGGYIKLPVRAFFLENLVVMFKDHMKVGMDLRPKLIYDMYPNRRVPQSGLVLNLKHFIKPFQKTFYGSPRILGS